MGAEHNRPFYRADRQERLMEPTKKWGAWYWITVGMGAVIFWMLLANFAPPKKSTPPPVRSVQHVWTKADSLAYAHDQIEVFAQNQFSCLSNLWGKESAWDPKAYNRTTSQGKHAGGIPQLLGMSPLVLPVIQIDRGLANIYFKYTTPCKAWQHWKAYSWY